MGTDTFDERDCRNCQVKQTAIEKFEKSIKVSEFKIIVSSRYEIKDVDIHSALIKSFSRSAFAVEKLN